MGRLRELFRRAPSRREDEPADLVDGDAGGDVSAIAVSGWMSARTERRARCASRCDANRVWWLESAPKSRAGGMRGRVSGRSGENANGLLAGGASAAVAALAAVVEINGRREEDRSREDERVNEDVEGDDWLRLAVGSGEADRRVRVVHSASLGGPLPGAGQPDEAPAQATTVAT